MSFRPEEVPGVYLLLEMVQEGCPGHGPVHALVACARRIGFSLGSRYAWVGEAGSSRLE